MLKPRTAFPIHLRLLLTSWIIAAFGATATVHAEEVLIASGHPNWPPFTWQEGERIIGIGAELTEIIFKDLGITVISKPVGNWKRVQAETEYGSIDVIASIYLTTDRKKYLEYPDTPYLEDENVLWVVKGKEFPFRKWEDLIGRHGTAMLGESYGEKFDRFIKDKLSMEWVTSPLQNLKKLELGRSDYYPFSVYGGQIQVRQHGFEGRIVHLPEVISKEGVYIAISKKSRFLQYLPQLEKAIKKRHTDGTIDRLARKYIALGARASTNP